MKGREPLLQGNRDECDLVRSSQNCRRNCAAVVDVKPDPLPLAVELGERRNGAADAAPQIALDLDLLKYRSGLRIRDNGRNEVRMRACMSSCEALLPPLFPSSLRPDLHQRLCDSPGEIAEVAVRHWRRERARTVRRQQETALQRGELHALRACLAAALGRSCDSR